MHIIIALLMLLIGTQSSSTQPSQISAEFTYVFEGDLYSIYLSNDTWQTENLTKSFAPEAWFPVWSPNGQYLAFLASDSELASLYVMDHNGLITELKAGLPHVGSLVWSPGSNMLAYTTLETGKMANRLHIQNLATSDSLDLPNKVAGCCVNWLSASSIAYIGEESWSPHYLKFDRLDKPVKIPWNQFQRLTVTQLHIRSHGWDKTLNVTFRQADPKNQYLAVILFGVRPPHFGAGNPPRLIIYDGDLQEMLVITGIMRDSGSWRPLPLD